MFVRLCYRSTALIPIDGDFIASISESAHRNNITCGITGALLFDEFKFLQVIEGDEESIETIYAKIKKDPRHFEIELMEYSFVDQMYFSFWSMKIILISKQSSLISVIFNKSKAKVDELALPVSQIVRNHIS